MPRLIYLTICCLFLLAAPAVPSHGGLFPWSDDTLVTIDDKTYPAEDFRSWWLEWREPGMPFPETPDPFIDWMLLVREAERMKLYEDAAYRQKVLTFLKARTLILLKAEEVDSKIIISEKDLWDRYQQEYIPRYQLNLLFFHTREDADKLLATVGRDPISDEHLAELASGEGGPVKVETGWYRKISVDPGWHEIIDGLEPGKLSEPVDWRMGVVVLRLQELKEGDREDFATVRKGIHETLWKEQDHSRTVELLKSLREKYHVQVDTERLEKLDINAADGSFSDDPIVTTDKGTVSEKDFMAEVRGLQKFRSESGLSDDNGYQYKQKVLDGIISQTLTSWEGLDRGYEKKPPFKAVYEFYCQHRMIKTLERRLFAPKAEVTPEEVESYYKEHLEEYGRPDMVRLASVTGDPGEMKAIWTETAMGGDFQAIARKRFGSSFAVQEVPAAHLSAETAEVVRKLAKGELSPVFSVNGRASLVQLIERIPSQPIPLAQAGKKIQGRLSREKMERARQEYLARLRAGSSIAVNNKVWQQLKKEMEQTDAAKTQE